jgi:CelD/BcsL family acetyltransferase involved in cellulose biosynthesis
MSKRPWTVDVRSDRAVFEELATWWNQCPGPTATPFLRSEWFELWCDAFLTERSSLEVVVWSEVDTPVAVLPLSRNGVRRMSLANSHSDVFDIVAATGIDPGPMVDDWMGHHAVTRLFRLDGHSVLSPSDADRRWHVDRRSDAPFIELDEEPGRVVEGLSRNLVKDVQRLERRLDEIGEVTYIDNVDGVVPDALDRCLRLEASGWKGQEGTAMSSRPESERFYRNLVDLARERGWLRLCALMVGDRIAAFELDLDYAGRRFSLKAGYDEYWSRQSPGKVLQLRVLEAAAALGLTTYEFGGIAEPWKMQWAKQTRPRVNALRFGDRGVSRWIGLGARAIAARRPVDDDREA